MMDKVAVIMSVYRSDNANHLKDAVDSILCQVDIEPQLYLYVDGPVPADISKYLSVIESMKNIFVFHGKENIGLAGAMNFLVEKIFKKDIDINYIARMDSDDISLSERLSKQVKFLKFNQEVDVCGTYCEEFGATYSKHLKTVPTEHMQLLDFSITRCPFIHPSVMFRSKIFSNGFRYPTNTELTEDMAFWFVLLKNGFTFANIDIPLVRYRLAEDTVYRRGGFKKAWSEFYIRFKYMIKLNKVSLKNIILIVSRLGFHLLPVPLLKFAYKYLR